MVRRSTSAKKVDERRFRFRVRLSRPPGIGAWDVMGLTTWLAEKLGRRGYGFHDDEWDGHAGDTYAIHLDDHSVIPDLLAYLDAMGIERVPIKTYHAEIGANLAAALLEGLSTIKITLIDRINVI